jgi:long-chain acyl-CoA synthetase
VHAIIVPKPGADLTSDSVLEFCRSQIAGYKCPRSVDIRSEPFPLSGAGKVLKRELRRLHAEDGTPAQAKAG